MKMKVGISAAIASFLLVTSGILWGTTPGTSLKVQLVGQNQLFGRGMNAAATIFDHFLYVGNRTDGSSRCGIGDPRRTTTGLNSCPHPNPGVLVLDIKNPAAPTFLNEFGNEFTTGTFAGQTSRELRVWPEQKLLMVMYFRCSSIIHACTRPATDDWRIRFFDLSDPVHPALVSTYVPPSKPHEMFLWVDPNNGNRALLFLSTPNIFADANPNLIVTDISQARTGIFTEIARGNWNDRFPGTDQANYPFDATSRDGCGPYDCNLFVHSMGVKADGTLTFLALEAGHFLVLDTSQVAAGVRNPKLVLLTDPEKRPVWLQNPPEPDAVPLGSETLGVLLLLKAFAGGSVALTGVEAIANGVPAFKPPEARNAADTMTAMAILLAILFIGLTVFAVTFGLRPTEEGGPSIVALAARTAFGAGSPR